MLRLLVFGLFCLAIAGFVIACDDDTTNTVDDTSQHPEVRILTPCYEYHTDLNGNVRRDF